MFQVTYITASAFAKTKTFMSVDTWFHTISSHIPQSNRSVLQLEKKNTIAAPVNICKLFLIYISQLWVAVTTQQHGVGCGWLTKWVALPLISSPCLLPKQSRSKLKQMYLPTLQADPQLRQTCPTTPLFWAPAYQISSCLYSHSKKR